MIDRKNVVSGGSTGLIERMPCGNVRKCAYPDIQTRKQSLRDLEREFRIYQRLPRQHDRLLQMIKYSPEEGLFLQYMPRGNLREYIQTAVAGITISQRLQWTHDAAEALHLVHSYGIIHCDVKPENFLLDSAYRLKIIDFSGSSFDGILGSAFEGTRFCLPRSWDDESTVRTDLFALGSTIYEIMTGRQPYHDLPDDEVEARYSQQIFPEVQAVHCGQVIMACWRGEINTAKKAMGLIQVEIEKVQ
ncbi:kinase-like domain-containing protein [Apiosordaria backusii]|uniref:Kinase-like domain-containing protein n=1 Tax=Apiosordaria backusii TaxID=314023 RepID=A0AA40B7L7_9PEZI|nr:kinase-like domain-containing protein [Apiosordaria backusii]